MYIGYHAADITLCILSAIFGGFVLAAVDITPYAIVILEKVAVVHRINAAVFRTFDVGIAQAKFPYGRIDELVANGFERPKEMKQANLEDVFINLTGHSLREN